MRTYVTQINVPVGLIEAFQDRAQALQDAFDEIEMTNDERARLVEHVNYIYDSFTTFSTLTEDEALGDYEEETNKYVLHSDYKAEDLAHGSVLYAKSDSSFHLWTNEAYSEAYLVDTGSPGLFKGLKGMLKHAGKIKDVHIYMTHWHIDHCSSLGSFIKNTHSNIHLHIHNFNTLVEASRSMISPGC